MEPRQAQKTRAEASKLLALGQLEVDTDPTAALAYVTKSLELDDLQATRFFALRLLQSGPVASVVAEGVSDVGFNLSPDGEWLAMEQDGKIRLVSRDGRQPEPFAIPGEHLPGSLQGFVFRPDEKVLSVGFRDELRMFSVPDGREVKHVKYGEAVNFWCPHCGGAGMPDSKGTAGSWTLFERPWDGKEQRLIGTLGPSEFERGPAFTRDFSLMAYSFGRKIYLRSPTQWALPPRLLGEDPTEVEFLHLSDKAPRLVTADRSGEIRIWDTSSTPGRLLRVFEAPAKKGRAGVRDAAFFGPEEGWLFNATGGEGHVYFRLWDLTAPPGARPVVARTKASGFRAYSVDPRDRRLAAVDDSGRVLFWPLSRVQPRVFDWQEGTPTNIAFMADGKTLVAATQQGDLRAWPLSAEAPAAFQTLPKAKGAARIAASPTRKEIVVGTSRGRVQVIPVDGGEPRELEGFAKENAWAVAFSPDGRQVAAATLDFSGAAKEKRIHVWDLETGAVRVLEPVPGRVH